MFEKENEDKTSENEIEELFTDDTDDLFGNEEVEEKDSDEPEKKEDGEKKDDKNEDKPKSKDSAIIQKQKYREKLKEALKELDKIKSEKKDEPANLTEEQQKEKAAREYLAKEIREILKQEEAQKSTQELRELDEFQDELEEVLDDHSDFTEQQILDLCEELDVSPRQAAKIALRESKLGKGKPKPVLPQPKRGSPEIKDTPKKGERPPALSEVSRSLKELIRQGKL